MKVFICGTGTPDDESSNKSLLSFALYLENTEEDKETFIQAHNRFRDDVIKKNLIFTIGRNKEKTKAIIIFFAKEPDGKYYKVFTDEDNKPYIEVEE